MKDVQATLRRIDEEIVGHKQQIAMHQVELVRLQDTRNVLMGLAEADIAHAESAKAERVNASLMAGEHAKPMLIVRPTGSGEAPKTVHARVNGHKKADKPKKQRRARAGSESAAMREKIMKVIDADTPMSSREIGDYLGLPRDEMARKAMSNALYQLKTKGELIRDGEHRYHRPRAQ